MKTITALALRDNLDEVVKRVRAGETIRVTYRSKPAFLLLPEGSSSDPLPGSQAAMRSFVQQVKELDKVPRTSRLNPAQPLKQLYHEMLDADPKHGDHHGR